jgi:hypothetical protein
MYIGVPYASIARFSTSMAYDTPAQKPRGEARIIVSIPFALSLPMPIVPDATARLPHDDSFRIFTYVPF